MQLDGSKERNYDPTKKEIYTKLSIAVQASKSHSVSDSQHWRKPIYALRKLSCRKSLESWNRHPNCFTVKIMGDLID